MLQQAQFGGLITDKPPDQLGFNAYYSKNMQPASAVNMRPRPGTSLFTYMGDLSSGARYVYAKVISGVPPLADDPNCTVLIVVINYPTGADAPEIQGQFKCFPGVVVYDYLNALVSPLLLRTLPETDLGTNLPTAVTYGNKFFLYIPDMRPLVIMPGTSFGSAVLKSYWCGIQPPTFYPTVVAGSDNANNIVYDDTTPFPNTLYFAYSFYSSKRGVYSQPSPLTRYVVPAPSSLTGTVAVEQGSTTITGTGTDFDPEISEGSQIVIAGVMVTIASRASDTEAEMTTPWIALSNTGLTAYQPPKKIDLTFFFSPRGTSTMNDGGETGDIDYVVVGVQSGINPGLMALYPQCFLPVPGYDVNEVFNPSPTMSFDLSPAQLALGFDLNALTGALFVPPAFKFSSRYKERIWLAGELDSFTFDPTSTFEIEPSLLSGTVSITVGSDTLTGDADTLFTDQLAVDDIIRINGTTYAIEAITDNDTATLTVDAFTTATAAPCYRLWRDFPYARLRLSGAETWSASQLYTSLYVNGSYIGEIFDLIDDGDSAYLLGDAQALSVPGNVVELVGHNDRIWPSSYDNHVPGNVVTPFPECVQLNNAFLLGQALDEGERITGLIAASEALIIAYQNSFTRLTIVADGGGVPEPDIRPYYGRAGCIAPRSLCQLPTGDIAWIGNEGIFTESGGSVRNLLAELESLMLLRGRQWIALGDISGMTMTFSRRWSGLVIGNFTINGEAGWWGLITFVPQLALCLFDNQVMTSNLLTYTDSNSQEQILTGDDQNRLKKLLDETVLDDLDATGDTSSEYTCEWRGTWQPRPDGTTWNLARVSVPGIICPAPDDLEMTLEIIRSNFTQREIGLVPASEQCSVALVKKHFRPGFDIGIPSSEGKFVSVGFNYQSAAGSYTDGIARPMEVTHWVGMEPEE